MLETHLRCLADGKEALPAHSAWGGIPRQDTCKGTGVDPVRAGQR